MHLEDPTAATTTTAGGNTQIEARDLMCPICMSKTYCFSNVYFIYFVFE